MNFRRGSGRDEPEMNLVPLIDVLLVILIFLMVTTTYARFAELQINLPEARGDSPKEAPAQINVGVDEQGGYRIDQAPVASAGGVEALVAALQGAAGTRKDPVIVISADAHASHQSVIRVMDAARRAGYPRVTFVTQSPAAD